MLTRLLPAILTMPCLIALTSPYALAQTGAVGATEAPAASHAQAPSPTDAPGPAVKRKALELYDRGVNAYRAGRYNDAIASFREADSLLPSAALSFNAARAYEKLLDSAQALRFYRDFLRRAPHAENSLHVTRRVKELEATLAARGVQQLTVLTKPPGATVLLDGTPRGVTPFTGELTPGKHQLELSLRGHRDLNTTLELPSDRAVDVSLELLPGNSALPLQAVSSAPRSATQRRSFGPWPFITLGAGGASLLTAGAFELSRRAAERDARREPTQLKYKEKLETVDARRDVARVFLGVGGALTVSGGVLWLLNPASSNERDSAASAGAPQTAVGFDGRQLLLRHRGLL